MSISFCCFTIILSPLCSDITGKRAEARCWAGSSWEHQEKFLPLFKELRSVFSKKDKVLDVEGNRRGKIFLGRKSKEVPAWVGCYHSCCLKQLWMKTSHLLPYIGQQPEVIPSCQLLSQFSTASGLVSLPFAFKASATSSSLTLEWDQVNSSEPMDPNGRLATLTLCGWICFWALDQ